VHNVTGFIDEMRSHVLALPDLAKFAIVVAVIVGVPPLAARVRLPPMVGLLLFGVVLGPHVLGFFGEHRPIADFFAELGKLLLMFSAGLEIDIALFRRAQARSIIFGLLTTTVPPHGSRPFRSPGRCPHTDVAAEDDAAVVAMA
jgi:Kef-type K+ transport system membrane component KefB